MPVVAVVEWHEGGHYPTYFRHFCLTLLQLNCTVVALCPDPDSVHAWLMATKPGYPSPQDQLHLVKFTAPAWPIRPSAYREAFNTLLFFPRLRRVLSAAERDLSKQLDLVFFASIDEPLFQHFPKSNRRFRWKWAGLYTQCRIFRIERYSTPVQKLLHKFVERLSHPGLQAIGLLEEDSVESMTRAFPWFKTVAFPDFVDTTSPVDDGPHRDLVAFAQKRPIIGLIGHLQPRKGLMTLVGAAMNPANADIVFAFAGDVLWTMFSAVEISIIDRLRKQPNVWMHFSRTCSEAQFNSLVCACDMVFAAYLDFPHSSNLLGKASWFERPVIVSDGHLMAQRVRKYGLGLIIPEGDPEALGLAIHSLLKSHSNPHERKKRDQADYNIDHSSERLKESFLQVLRR